MKSLSVLVSWAFGLVRSYQDSFLVRVINFDQKFKFQEKPVLLMTHSEDEVYCRAAVPSSFTSDTFNAKLWLQDLSKNLSLDDSFIVPIKNQNPELISILKIPRPNFEQDVIEKSLQAAVTFAHASLDK